MDLLLFGDSNEFCNAHEWQIWILIDFHPKDNRFKIIYYNHAAFKLDPIGLPTPPPPLQSPPKMYANKITRPRHCLWTFLPFCFSLLIEFYKTRTFHDSILIWWEKKRGKKRQKFKNIHTHTHTPTAQWPRYVLDTFLWHFHCDILRVERWWNIRIIIT